MDQISFYVTTVHVERERELMLAAERARVAAERAAERAASSPHRRHARRRDAVLTPTPVTH